MKRLLVVPVVTLFLLTAFVPASSADAPSVVFMGQGRATALNASAPLLNILGGLNLPLVGNVLGTLAKGMTVSYAETTFEGNANPQANGLALGLCGLLGNSILSLPSLTNGNFTSNLPALGAIPSLGGLGCAGSSQATSSSVGDQGSSTPKCASALSLAIITLQTGCASSTSSVASGRAVSNSTAGVAELKVSLVSGILGQLGLDKILAPLGIGGVSGTVGSITSGLPIVGNLVNGLLAPLTQNALGTPLTPGQTGDLLGSVTNLLQSVLGNAGDLLTVSLGPSSSILSSAGATSVHTTTASGATIKILGGLLQVDLSPSTSSVTWNDATSSATGHATAALANIKVGDLGGLTGGLLNLPINLPDVTGLLSGLLKSQDANGNLVLLGGTPLQTTIGLGHATPDSTGRSVTSAASGLTIKALQGLGATSLAAMDGGLNLELASTSASAGGDTFKTAAAAPALPITGGPTYVFLAGAAFMAVAAAHVLRSSRRLRATKAQ